MKIFPKLEFDIQPNYKDSFSVQFQCLSSTKAFKLKKKLENVFYNNEGANQENRGCGIQETENPIEVEVKVNPKIAKKLPDSLDWSWGLEDFRRNASSNEIETILLLFFI